MVKMTWSEDGNYVPESLCELDAKGNIVYFRGCGSCFNGIRGALIPCDVLKSDGTTNCEVANMMNEYAKLTGQDVRNKKEENGIMMENLFNGKFGRIEHGMCRLSVNGDIAVKTSQGYKAYNMKTGNLVNCSSFVFNIGEEMFFVIPTNKAEVGDILLIGGKPKCVISVDKKVITVIDYENAEIRQALPERHVFMGSTYFYGKIVSIFGNTNFLKGKNGMNRMMKFMMMGEMMKSMSGGSMSEIGMMGGAEGSGSGNMMQMMFMMNMFGGGSGLGADNMFEDMFDFGFDSDDDDNDDAENDGDENTEEGE